MRVRVIPYRQGSRGASELARALGGACIRLEGSRYVPRQGDLVINWGNTNPPNLGVRVINGRGIQNASNKLRFFETVARSWESEIIPAFWTSMADIPDDAFPIVCRTVLAGHSGEGIVIADRRDDLVRAPLYVKYVKKQDEYRVHIGQWMGEQDLQQRIIDIQQKKRNTENANPNWQVRNHANGFIYAREGVFPPVCVLDVASRALACSDLDFGAVDVIYNARENRAYVLEINTAPGITGTTVLNYSNYFRNL